ALFLDQSGDGEDQRRPRIARRSPELELGKIKPVINTAQLAVACRTEPAQQISAVVVPACDPGLGSRALGENANRAVVGDVVTLARTCATPSCTGSRVGSLMEKMRRDTPCRSSAATSLRMKVSESLGQDLTI